MTRAFDRLQAELGDALPVRLVVVGPNAGPSPNYSAEAAVVPYTLVYRVTAFTDGRPDEEFTTGNEVADHFVHGQRCHCRERTQLRLERLLGANIEWSPRARMYRATLRLVPEEAGGGRNVFAVGATVELALSSLAGALRRGEKEVVH